MLQSNSTPCATPHSTTRAPSFYEAFCFWLKLGFVSFGGPAGQIAMMQSEIVERKKWISQNRFLHALNYCMLLPGPEAIQLAIYIGWLLHKTLGGIVAGALFVLPASILLWALSYVYVSFGNISWIAGIFFGLKPAVVAIVASAVIKIGKKSLHTLIHWAVSFLAFIAIFYFKINYPIIIGGAALLGLFLGKVSPEKIVAKKIPGLQNSHLEVSVLGDQNASPPHTMPSLRRAVYVALIGIVVWWGPLALLGLWLGTSHTLFKEGIFFIKSALVTFRGAYAVLPYVSQQAVEHYQWLNAGQMLDGLGLAETTPGPLIIVLQFVGFLGGFNHPGSLPPLYSATLGAIITSWVTFIPCYIWIFLGGPYIEKLRGNKDLTAALSMVSAAVVGVILNLTLWCAIHLAVTRQRSTDWLSISLCLLAFMAILRFEIGIISVVFLGAASGVLISAFR